MYLDVIVLQQRTSKHLIRRQQCSMCLIGIGAGEPASVTTSLSVNVRVGLETSHPSLPPSLPPTTVTLTFLLMLHNFCSRHMAIDWPSNHSMLATGEREQFHR
jgi:hypothetical protein